MDQRRISPNGTNRPMIIIILSTGKSTRMRSETFHGQKSMLPMPDDRILLEWQVESLQHVFDPQNKNHHLIYISREEYRQDEEFQVSELLKSFDIELSPFSSWIHHWIENETYGALDALNIFSDVLRHLIPLTDDPRSQKELLILYNDEWIQPAQVKFFIETSRVRGLHASAVAFDNSNPRYSRVPGSSLATGCTYYFKSAYEFFTRLKDMPRGPENGVPDMVYSSIYWDIYYLAKNTYFELGTTDEYNQFLEYWKALHGSK
jgi:hypothetical protein